MRGKEPVDLTSATVDLTKSLKTSRPYQYGYVEYLGTWLILKLCCCFKKKACFKKREMRYMRHQLAEEQVAKETDFFRFLKLLRVTNFLKKINLRKYQRNLIPYFKKYQLTELEGDHTKQAYGVEIVKNVAHNLLDDDDEQDLLLC